MDKREFRQFLLTLLDDQHGISEEAYNFLVKTGTADLDIRMKVDASQDFVTETSRFYLPENHGLK